MKIVQIPVVLFVKAIQFKVHIVELLIWQISLSFRDALTQPAPLGESTLRWSFPLKTVVNDNCFYNDYYHRVNK